MKNNGNHRPRDYAVEIAVGQNARAIPPAARPGLLDWLRRANHGVPARRRTGRPPRAFWLLDPATGEWRLL